jgi:hypothetical protein
VKTNNVPIGIVTFYKTIAYYKVYIVYSGTKGEISKINYVPIGIFEFYG